jgi:hypothetical protein
MQRFALIGISLRHSVQLLVVGSDIGSLRVRAISKFIGLTTKKNTEPDTSRNEISEFIKSPYINLLPLIVKARLLKSGTFAIAAIRGVSRSFTKAETIVPKAAL